MSQRANALADRLAAGAAALAEYASKLSDKQWKLPVLPDKRTVGVIVHHVGNMYPIESPARRGACGRATPITDVTWDAVHKINADHAHDRASGQGHRARLPPHQRRDGRRPRSAASATRSSTGRPPMSLYAGLRR